MLAGTRCESDGRGKQLPLRIAPTGHFLDGVAAVC
jgi:hypothetical protein